MDPQLIHILADGLFHSGEKLGGTLGVSRAAVWKQIQQLEAVGIHVESVRGRGYRIPGGIEHLNRREILAALTNASRAKLSQLFLFDTLDSTNRHLAERVTNSNCCVCISEFQTEGRGRRGRSWLSPYGKNVCLSIGWHFEGGATALEGLSLAIGVAVRRALGSHPLVNLKWPNDVLFEKRKLAGILIEMQGDPSGLCKVIIGVGVNCSMLGSGHPPPIDQPWADATELGFTSRNSVAASLVSHLIEALIQFESGGFAVFRDEWNESDATRGLEVTLSTPISSIDGLAQGVAENGALMLLVGDELKECHGGEVSLRWL